MCWLTGWLAGCWLAAGWLLADWLAGCSLAAGWLAGWLLAGCWLAGWLDGPGHAPRSHPPPLQKQIQNNVSCVYICVYIYMKPARGPQTKFFGNF
jgi:hypothetical protein